MDSADARKLISVSGYYATDSGRKEVERGLHDGTLLKNSITRENWLASWNLKSNSVGS